MNSYYVYILAGGKNGVLYIGVTSDLKKRLYEHRTGKHTGFSRKYNTMRLVYYEEYNDVKLAIEREKVLKKWKREWKVKKIEESNPLWKDLSADWEWL